MSVFRLGGGFALGGGLSGSCGSFLGLCGGFRLAGCCFGSGLLLGDGLRTLLVHLGLGGHAGFLGRTGVGGELVVLRGDAALFVAQPFVESGLGVRFREGSFGNASKQVLLVKHALVGEDGPTGVGGLCAFEQPIQSFFEVQIDRSRIRVGVVGSQLFDEFTITWRPAVGGDDMIEGVAFLTMTCQTNFNSHLL